MQLVFIKDIPSEEAKAEEEREANKFVTGCGIVISSGHKFKGYLS